MPWKLPLRIWNSISCWISPLSLFVPILLDDCNSTRFFQEKLDRLDDSFEYALKSVETSPTVDAYNKLCRFALPKVWIVSNCTFLVFRRSDVVFRKAWRISRIRSIQKHTCCRHTSSFWNAVTLTQYRIWVNTASERTDWIRRTQTLWCKFARFMPKLQ